MTTARTGSTPTPFGFVGQGQYQTDADTGLMLLGHRYYDASTGRFLSADPAQVGTNWYEYCDNDPLNRADPSGLYSFDNYNPGGTNGQHSTLPINATGNQGGNPTLNVSSGGDKPTTGVIKITIGSGTIQTTIVPPQSSQPPGSPTGTTGAGPGSGTILGTFPIGKIGPVGLQGSIGGTGKLDGSSTGRTTVGMTGTSTTTNKGVTTTSGTGTVGYNPGGGWTVGVTQTGGTLRKGTTMLTIGYSG
jgi:RHS repeat-associated protein